MSDAGVRIAIAFHSRGGHTRVLAECVAAGVERVAGAVATLLDVGVESLDWNALEAADAIVFGSPTYMGSVSGPFKCFMDASSKRAWRGALWRDKLAAGFTTSSSSSGDKLNTLMQLALFAAQHQMLWVSLGLPPGNFTTSGSDGALNRLGSFLGAMARSVADEGPEVAPPEADRETARALGQRVAEAAIRWQTGQRVRSADVHPTTRTWALPPKQRPDLPGGLRRTNLRALCARPERFEHHLLIVGVLGDAQLEVATASEPLYFAHANISDEWALPLATGDELIDSFPLRTFLSDPNDHRDVGRVNHRIGDIVLHPYGYLHWPGRLRPPYEPFEFGPGARRTVLSFVFCGCRSVGGGERRLGVPEDRADVAKAYVESAPPFAVVPTGSAAAGRIGTVGDAQLSLLVEPERIAPEGGGYVLVLDARAPHFATDLIWIPPGGALDGAGIVRALLATTDGSVQPPPSTWDEAPAEPFPPAEAAAPAALPFEHGALRVSALSDDTVRVDLPDGSAEIPRYWLARFLFRVALHGYRMGYLETYGGFFYDDRGGEYRLGARDCGAVRIEPGALPEVIETLYRAVAPPGHVERIE